MEKISPTATARLGTDEEWHACAFEPYGALPMVGESWQKRSTFELDDIPRQEGHPYSRKRIWYDKETMSPGLAVVYDRAGKVYKLIGGVGKWSESTGLPENQGRRAARHVGDDRERAERRVEPGPVRRHERDGFGIAESRSTTTRRS
jgi:hypothetical protein